LIVNGIQIQAVVEAPEKGSGQCVYADLPEKNDYMPSFKLIAKDSKPQVGGSHGTSGNPLIPSNLRAYMTNMTNPPKFSAGP
jgi:hypothetical protein